MPGNLLQQLQRRDVPPPPRSLGRGVHERVNQWLLLTQTADLVLRAFAYAAVHFGAAVVGMISYSLTGKFPRK